MARIRFLYSNRYTSATLTASSAASALPVGASQSEDRTYVFQSLQQTGVQTLDIDCLSVVAASAIALANVRLLGSGVVELYQRGDSASPGSAVLVATLPPSNTYTRTTFAFFASQSHRHWQLKWTNPTSANDYAQVGFVFLGVEVEPAINIRVPANITRVDPSVSGVSIGGQKSFALRTKMFAGEWNFDDVTETQLGQLQTLFETIGASGAHFVVLDTALPWTCWLARLAGQMRQDLAIVTGRYPIALPWQEVC